MGASFSSTSTYLQYKNDFELVIRATKDLEHLLETGFDAPSGKTVGLHDKISAVQTSHGLSEDTVKKLRWDWRILAWWNNCILVSCHHSFIPNIDIICRISFLNIFFFSALILSSLIANAQIKRYLVTLRNKLVHEYEFNKLPDRVRFAKSYDSVEKELKAKMKVSSTNGCVICWSFLIVSRAYNGIA